MGPPPVAVAAPDGPALDAARDAPGRPPEPPASDAPGRPPEPPAATPPASDAASAPSAPRRTVVDLRPLRPAGAALLGAALVLPLLPGPPGLACPLRSLTGVPCPLCGTTRSMAAAVRGHLVEALALSPLGLAAVVAAAVLLVVRRPPSLTLPAWAPPAAAALLWAYQLWRASPLPGA